MMGKTNVNSSRFIVIPVSAQFALSASILFFFCYGLHFQTAWFTDEDSVIASFKLVTILMFFSTVLTWFLAFQFELLDKCHSTNDSVIRTFLSFLMGREGLEYISRDAKKQCKGDDRGEGGGVTMTEG